MYSIIRLAVLTLLLNCVLSQSALCPRTCRCTSRKIVYCNERQLSLIPYGIPSDTTTLHLQLNNLINGPTTDEVLSSLTELRKLVLHHNKLTSVPKGLASSLHSVDFRNNRIKYVGKSALKELTSLTELHLDENNITNQGLSPHAFQDTRNLNILILSDNLLTEFPENLPISLRLLRLNNNRINFISRKSMQKLKNLINLDLSQNAIVQTRMEKYSIRSLTSLRVLDFSRNQLSQIPIDLPPKLEELLVSDNRIEYLYKRSNHEHGSLNSVQSLSIIDLSSNSLKSVEAEAFSNLNLHSIELHDNPWQCDCHLRYLKRWLASEVTILSSESDIACFSPTAFAGVTLNSIDEEALKCVSRLSTKMKVFNISSSGFFLKWKSPYETPDPPFIRRSLIYGPLKCDNCSVEESLVSGQSSAQDAISLMENYSSQEISSDTQTNLLQSSIHISKLQPNTRYAACELDSAQEDTTVSINQCLSVKTLPEPVGLASSAAVVFIPIWAIALSCAVFLVLFITVLAYAIWKKRKSLKSKVQRQYDSNRDDIVYSPELYLPGLTRHMTYGSSAVRRGYETNLSDRTYAECGPPNSNSTGVRTMRDTAVDARMEFDVLIKSDEEDTSARRHRTPTTSTSRFEQLFLFRLYFSSHTS